MTTAEAFEALLADPGIRPYVDTRRDIPAPFVGTGEIRLFIIGQDPTVGRQVNMVLTLDEPRSPLRRFIRDLANLFGMSLDEHVYATNLCKNFFIDKPTTIDAVDVIRLTAPHWLPVLCNELATYPDALVISLGEPLLKALVTSGNIDLKHYWGYRQGWHKKPESLLPMSAIEADQSAVNRRVFPFPHQPTFVRNRRGEFYRQRITEYVEYCMKTHQGQ